MAPAAPTTLLVEEGRINIEELRSRLVARFAMLTMLLGGIGAWITLARIPFPAIVCLLCLLAAGCAWVAYWCAYRWPVFSRWWLVGGLATLVLTAASWLELPELLFFSPAVIFAAALLIPGSESIYSMLILVVGWRITATYPTDFSLPLLVGVVVTALGGAWLATRTLYVALQWVWDAQARSNALLVESRANRAELARTLKSYELANSLLRRTEQGLIEARRQAESAQRAKEQFAANVSHEFRTPLNLILGFSEIMYTSPEVYGMAQWPATLRRDVAQIYQSSRHLLEMVDDILALSHFELAGFTINREPTDLAELITSTVEIIADLFRTSELRLEWEIMPGLPELELDRTRIRQVLLNLLNNAFRFTEEGSVRVRAWQEGDEVIVCVSDTGPGIAPDKQPYIFDEFYQVDLSLRRSQQGTGLGLAICKRFVEMHDGHIWVESVEHAGAAFYFSLPIPNTQLLLSRMRLSSPLLQVRPAQMPTILLVDSDPLLGQLVQRQIEGYEVHQLIGETELNEAIQQTRPVVVLRNGQHRRHDPARDTHAPMRSASTLIPDTLIPGTITIDCPLPSQSRWVAAQLAAGYLAKPVSTQQILLLLEEYPQAKHVLVVDDDRGFVQLVIRILQTSGRHFEIRHAYDGREGLAALEASCPDLILLDLRMPGMDGMTFLEQMRQHTTWRTIPVVLLTATQRADQIITAQDCEFIIRRDDGWQTAEVLQMLDVLLPVLRPHYDALSTGRALPVAATR